MSEHDFSDDELDPRESVTVDCACGASFETHCDRTAATWLKPAEIDLEDTACPACREVADRGNSPCCDDELFGVSGEDTLAPGEWGFSCSGCGAVFTVDTIRALEAGREILSRG